MAKRAAVDKWLFIVTLILVVIGLVMIFSASAVVAKERYHTEFYFVERQFVFAILGVLTMAGLARIDYKKLNNPIIVFAGLAVTAVLLVLSYFQRDSHGAHRWVRLGPLSLQPSELAKPAIILFLAWFLSTRTKQLDDWKHTLGPAVAPSLLLMALIFKQPDLGTAMVCFAITALILISAGMQLKYLWYSLGASIPVLYIALFRTPWRLKRMLAFLDPYADPQGSGFHIIQSMIAVGTGGVTGLGLMEGKQKLFYLPEPQTDFIFAVVAEEWGIIGAAVIVLLFAIFVYRGLRTALATRDLFAKFIAVGVITMVGVQAFFNISVVLGMLPTKGIPLPFVSYGGSSLLITLASVGVLLNITQQTD